jgi:regulator of protease activity HflC (stomatin/prohibitin superfamily)
MSLLKKTYQVKPNTIGFFYRNNVLEQKLDPGYFEVFDFRNRTELILLPSSSRFMTITNQEVLTKDNIALRFSFTVLYKISDGQKFLSKFALDKNISYVLMEAEQRLSNLIQISVRKTISELDSEILNEKRIELLNLKNKDIEEQSSEYGILIEEALLKDLTFPKSIQDLFAKHLEAKIRSKSDLENARTAVATARALKNASELMKDDDNIKFFQLIETINKIAEKGKHSFMIGDFQQLIKK